ncbi:AraC family transcriptional regulator [Pseudidiomarina insulisalsae]|uniref:AraC family transcriptional regulator n=1 Tax=Pseudidiomarina insulisalsae TaxID=575789 RepID=A0A432YMM0_9GAMM|nr:AraC family transcriptional regulator [Pseudidiomarina insulisalsae]RUO62227.1 AraC family transcriptional regulator [Pseudidiomarina insulisalsae]
MTTTLKPSVTQSFTQAIMQQLEHLGVSIDAGLKQQVAEHRGHARLPLALQDALWQSLEKQNCPELGLRIGLALQPQHFDTIGFLLLSSPSLGVATESLVNYSALIGEGGTFTTEATSDGYKIIYNDQFDVAVALRIEAIFASIATGANWVAGKPLAPLRVTFKHSQQAPDALYQQAFQHAALTFDQDENAITFSAQDWHFRQREVNPQLQSQMLQLAQQQLAQLHPQSFAARVEALLQRQPWLSRAQLAASLAITERTLSRRLAAEGTSFHVISQQMKKQHAFEQLQSSESVTQARLAEFLGYSDEQAFAKAFRRWTGQSFSAYRRRSVF